MRLPLSVGLSAIAILLSAPAAARPDLNAFVNRKATNTSSLLGQVKSDREVSDRYQRHFAMDRQNLMAYLSDLHPGPLAKEGYYTVYSVPEGGRVKMHVEKLRKGEPMFFDSKGKPILILKCGNPVVLGPSRARRSNPKLVTTTEPKGGRELALERPRPTEGDIPSDLLAMTPPVPSVVPEPGDIGGPIVPPINTVPATATGGGGAFPWYAGLPLLIPIFGGFDGGNGGSEPEPVPEPATMVVLGLGALAAMRRRQKG